MLQRFADTAAVEAEIERVRALSGDGLRRRWQSLFGRPPPDSLTPDLLRRMIANRVQEQGFGTLDRATLKLLDGMARRDGFRRSERRNLKPGTVLVRDHGGRRHTVTVERDGFVWEGNAYSSLSAIARAITGTAWSGPRFFALKRAGEGRRSKSSSNPADARRRWGRPSRKSQSATAASHAPP
jgi:hypothetical protein